MLLRIGVQFSNLGNLHRFSTIGRVLKILMENAYYEIIMQDLKFLHQKLPNSTFHALF